MRDPNQDKSAILQRGQLPAVANTEDGIRLDARLLVFLAALVPILTVIHAAGDRHFDFGVFYYAAHMVLDGSRHSLYDLGVQRAFQARFHRPPQLLFYYPPYALIPFLCIAVLPIELAFSLWTAASLIVLVWSIQLLAKASGVRYGNMPVLLSLAFAPVAANLANGQVSLMIVGVYVLTYALWRDERRFLGGAVLAIATFKFQLVLGFVAVLMLKRKWRELAGFSSGCALLFVLSVLVAGISWLRVYPVFLRYNEVAGSEPRAMANWRGLMSLAGGNHLWLLAGLSVVTILWAAYAWTNLDRGFSSAVLATMLVSYHFHPQDLSLLLVPFFLSRKDGVLPASKLPMVAFLLLLLPMALAAVNAPYALLAIVLAAALVWIGLPTRRPSLARGLSAGSCN
jgi:hypothetical protein